MLREATARGAGRLVQADVRALPFAKGVFEGAWACASLLHLPKTELPDTLAEVRRALDHGHVGLVMKAGEGESWRDDGDGRRRFFAYYHPAEVELALERGGFRVMYCAVERDSRRPTLNWINAIGWTKLITPRVGVNVAVFNDRGQVLLTRRHDNGLWCLPGGHMDMAETIEHTAIRETEEETGLAIQLERLVGLYSSHYSAGTFGENSPAHSILIALFRARATAGNLVLNPEVTEFGWFPPDQLPVDIIPHHIRRVHDAARETGGVVIA
jgi:8-oxo-dGTP pyrophosphatase MutT (NUDIX family)